MASQTKNEQPASPPSSVSPSELAEKVRSLNPQQRQELSRLLAAKRKWSPLPGPQSEALASPADVLLFGGAAGGGKTDLVLGLAHLHHKRAIVFRREYTELRAVLDRSLELFDGAGELNRSEMVWSLKDGRQVEFGACQHPGDEQKFQGRAHDLKAFDEITRFTEAQFRFLIGWLRSADPKQRCRVVCTGNPPTTAEGEWVIRYWAPWLDPQHPRPARPGELRWYSTIDGKDFEAETGAPFTHKGELITPRSRTFIPARVTDNPHLVASGYVAQLQALPEPLRSKMLFGDFTAGREDDIYQVIPSEWVRLAQARWTAKADPGPMDAMGVDVARGGADRTVLSPRHGAWFAEQLAFPGATTPDGPAVAALVMTHRTGGGIVNVDVIGVGSSVYDSLRAAIGAKAVAINGSAGSTKRDKSGQLGFLNLRAELWWSLREALDPASGEDLALPPDPGLRADLCAPKWKLSARGIQVESKEDLIKRLGRSPDKGDSAVYALAHPAAGFFEYAMEELAKHRAQTAAPAPAALVRLVVPDGGRAFRLIDGYRVPSAAAGDVVEVPAKYSTELQRLGFRHAT